MQPSITDVIAFEVKKEIADRYFGFRKLIEDDKLELSEKIKQHSFILEKRISFDLLRLYFLLKNEKLIQDFLALSGMEKRLFYDPQLTDSSTVLHRVFEGVRFRGFTRTGRFKNFGFDCYDRLVVNIDQYSKKIKELQAFQETISEQIRLFYKKNDLCVIMGFLRSLGDEKLCSGLDGGMEVGMAARFEEKMRIAPPFPIEQHLPIIPPLTPLNIVQRDMKKLIKLAYRSHDPELLKIFANKRFIFVSR